VINDHIHDGTARPDDQTSALRLLVEAVKRLDGATVRSFYP